MWRPAEVGGKRSIGPVVIVSIDKGVLNYTTYSALILGAMEDLDDQLRFITPLILGPHIVELGMELDKIQMLEVRWKVLNTEDGLDLGLDRIAELTAI